ncbi:MAG: protein jag [Dehalococcoidia bacterium]|nr:MAG: protein jag [Dehalococcoidia bacterium]
MKEVEISAKSVETAIQQALEQLGVARDEVEVTILSEGKTGILGMGGEEARVRVTLLAPEEESEVAEAAKEVLEMLLDKMGMAASVTPGAQPKVEGETEAAPAIAFDINGDDLGILIGRRGQTLSCLQYMVRLIIAHQRKVWLPIFIDVGGYKQRRHQTLQALALRVAEQVKAKEVPFTLEPMPAYERRIIHITLANHPDVTTQSIGEGEMRKVVILPQEK